MFYSFMFTTHHNHTQYTTYTLVVSLWSVLVEPIGIQQIADADVLVILMGTYLLNIWETGVRRQVGYKDNNANKDGRAQTPFYEPLYTSRCETHDLKQR